MPLARGRPFDIGDRLLPPAEEETLRTAIRGLYGPAGTSDEVIEIEVQTRHFWFRARYAEWFDATVGLADRTVLEIGAGSGTSTIAFAERGACVTAVDLNARALEVAELRAGLHGVGDLVTTARMNAAELESHFPAGSFDLIVFSASLEHMTHPERMAALAGAWQSVRPGGWLAVCDAPNRLWFYDNHTAMHNFFHWLPDDLAARYAARTSRPDFNQAFTTPSPSEYESLSRWGRGVSFHDFEVALAVDVRDLVVDGEWEFRRGRHPDWAESYLTTLDGRYHELLKAIAPELPVPFLEEEIAVWLQRPTTAA